MESIIRIQPKSFQAKIFWTEYFKPFVIDNFLQNINATPLSILICAPGASELMHGMLEEIKEKWGFHDTVEVSYAPDEFEDEEQRLTRVVRAGRNFDVIVGILTDNPTAIRLFSQYKSKLPVSKLLLIIDKPLLSTINISPDLVDLYKTKSLIKRELDLPDFISTGKLHILVGKLVHLFRAAKCHYSHYTHSHLATQYHTYQKELNLITSVECLFLLTYLIYITADTGSVEEGILHEHVKIPHGKYTYCLDLLQKIGFMKMTNAVITLTQSAPAFLESLSFRDIPQFEDTSQQFHSRWKTHIEQTITSHESLFIDMRSLHECGKSMYQAFASNKLRYPYYWLKTRLHKDWLPAEQRAYWNHPLVQKYIFPLWQEHIGEWTSVLTDRRDRARFLSNILKWYHITWDKRNEKITTNFDELVFSLGMLRPNNTAHIYIGYSFKQRRIPALIREYLKIAVITGRYDLLLKRYPPYHVMLNLHATPGKRTVFDSRSIDFKPLTIPLNFEYVCAIRIPKTQTRQAGRHIEIPVYIDKEKEALRQSDIQAREIELKNIFPNPRYFSDIEFDLDAGKVLHVDGRKREEISMYGKKRAMYIQKEDELKLLKLSPPVPRQDSGLIVRFKLREPLSALLEGLGRKRPFSLDEICHIQKIIDLYKSEIKKSGDERRTLDEIITLVLAQPNITGLSESTCEFIGELNRIRQEDPSESSAWQYVIHQALDGKRPELLPTLCDKLTTEGFDLVFSLIPLLTGQELDVGSGEDINVTLDKLEYSTSKPQEDGGKVTRLFITETLQIRIAELLHQVFTRYVDISAATRSRRSEAILAQLIVEECLKFRGAARQFKDKLRCHLSAHYKTNREFIETTYIDLDDPNPVVPTGIRIYSANSWEESLDIDVNGIVKLIEQTRQQLFSRGQSNRLLCFIDQSSINVTIGDFLYSGDDLEKEINSLSTHMNREREEHDNKHKLTSERERRKAETENEEQISHYEKLQRDRELLEEDDKLALFKKKHDRHTLESLAHGDIAQFMRLILTASYEAEQMHGISKIVENNPDMINVAYPGAYESWEARHTKERIFNLLENSQTFFFEPKEFVSLLKETSNIKPNLQSILEILSHHLPEDKFNEVKNLLNSQLADAKKQESHKKPSASNGLGEE